MQEFKATLDTQSKIITAVLTPLFLLMPLTIWLALRNEQDRSYEWYLIIIGIFLFLTYFFCYFISPKKYTVDKDSLMIHDLITKYNYPLSDIEKVEKTDTKAMGFLIRMFGNGGIFGYTGYFTSKTYGRMRFFVTDKNKLVLVYLKNGKKIVISPDDPDGFLKAMRK